MRWTVANLLRPVVFVLAIVVAVVVGDESDSFWFGLLAFIVSISAGRVARALVQGRLRLALARVVWPGAATGFAFLFDGLGLPTWATFFVSLIAASLTSQALRPLLPGEPRIVVRGTWRSVDLDELLP